MQFIARLFEMLAGMPIRECLSCHKETHCKDLGDGDYICTACWDSYVPSYEEET